MTLRMSAAAFHIGQPVWVLQRDGSLRPAEYVGEASSDCPYDQGKALVIFVDAPSHDAVDVGRLRPR
jgi:hypothetical protein